MAQMREITVNLPAALVDSAVSLSGKGITETIQDALEQLKYDLAWKELADLRGQVSFGASWQELRGKSDED